MLTRPSGGTGSKDLETCVVNAGLTTWGGALICGGMSWRTTRPRRQHGPDAIDYQLADHDSHTERRRADTRVIETFGRADQGDPAAWRRLAQSLLRGANAERIDLPARQVPPEVGLDDSEPVSRDGVLAAAHAWWEELGLGPLLREKLAQDGCPAPHDTALFALTAKRLARPASTLACYDHWLADDVYGPDAQGLALEHLYRALDFLLPHLDALAPALFFRTAERFNAEVDVVCWETTTLYCEIDAEEDAGEDWPGRPIPALRTRGPPHRRPRRPPAGGRGAGPHA